jgi:predicted DNA-binding transcriptional regulator YafY
MQIPYTAEIEVKNKLGIIELKNFITAQAAKNRYICEFHSVELFLGVLISINADIKIISPDWLRTRALDAAQRIINSNKE